MSHNLVPGSLASGARRVATHVRAKSRTRPCSSTSSLSWGSCKSAAREPIWNWCVLCARVCATLSLSCLTARPSFGQGLEGDVVVRGLTENQGGFSFVLLDNPGNKGPHKATVSHLSRRVVTNPRRARVGDNAELSRTHYFGGHAETDVLWRLRDTVQAPLAASFQSVAHRLKEANKDIRKQAWRVRPVLPNDIQDDMNRQACMRCHAGSLPPYRARRLCVSSIVLQRVLRLPFEIDVAWVPHEQCVWRYLPRDVSIASCYPSWLQVWR